MKYFISYWRSVTLVLCTGIFSFLVFSDHSELVSYLPAFDFLSFTPFFLLFISIVGLNKFESKNLAYLLSSLLIVPVGIMGLIVLAWILRSFPLIDQVYAFYSKGWINIVLWLAVWFGYSLGLRSYYVDWVHPKTRLVSMSLSILLILVLLPVEKVDVYSVYVFIPLVIVVFVPAVFYLYTLSKKKIV